jgi:aldose 1-epimerase
MGSDVCNTTTCGRLPDGRQVELFAFTNGSIDAAVMSYGGTITTLRVPDRHGHAADVVLRYDTLAGYLAGNSYFGALIGRYANRIARGRFTLDGRSFQLATNDGPNHLHGGVRGFDKQLWNGAAVENPAGVGVRLSRTSPGGEEQYPGTVNATVTYVLTNRDELVIEYEARADAPTIINLTQHTYFNLSAASRTTILDHELTLHADAYTPVDATLIPTGDLSPVADTPFDFRVARPIRSQWDADDEQLRRAGGYDHNYVVRRNGDGSLVLAAELYAPCSGRTLEVWTTEPGIQFYDGHLLDAPHTGLCLETQHFPDSPNRSAFPSTLLLPAETYRSTTVWRFGHR